jgi:TPR repeat protein
MKTVLEDIIKSTTTETDKNVPSHNDDWLYRRFNTGVNQYRQGLRYYHGNGVKQDYEQAVFWFTEAAEQGHAKAQSFLGFCYYAGRGVKQNYAQATIWCTAAAVQGDAVAQLNLGIFYIRGIGVRQDYVQAVNWYTKAAEQGHAKAQFNLQRLR